MLYHLHLFMLLPLIWQDAPKSAPERGAPRPTQTTDWSESATRTPAPAEHKMDIGRHLLVLTVRLMLHKQLPLY